MDVGSTGAEEVPLPLTQASIGGSTLREPYPSELGASFCCH
jgi:hypothetical protein